MELELESRACGEDTASRETKSHAADMGMELSAQWFFDHINIWEAQKCLDSGFHAWSTEFVLASGETGFGSRTAWEPGDFGVVSGTASKGGVKSDPAPEIHLTRTDLGSSGLLVLIVYAWL